MTNINTTENIKNRLTDSQIDCGISQIAEELASYPKYTIALPIVEGKPSTVEVCYNGYVIRIKCGISVDVPEPIYMLLKHSDRLNIK